jgi:hypothetical protein
VPPKPFPTTLITCSGVGGTITCRWTNIDKRYKTAAWTISTSYDGNLHGSGTTVKFTGITGGYNQAQLKVTYTGVVRTSATYGFTSSWRPPPPAPAPVATDQCPEVGAEGS